MSGEDFDSNLYDNLRNEGLQLYLEDIFLDIDYKCIHYNMDMKDNDGVLTYNDPCILRMWVFLHLMKGR